MTSELEKLEKIANLLSPDKTLTFDMTRTNKHWLLDYEYFFVSKNLSEDKLYTDTSITFRNKQEGVSPYEYIKTQFEYWIKDAWSEKISIGRIDLLAWSKFTVEKDTGLCYIYDEKDNYKGIFCHCMNRENEYIYVGQSIEDFFDLDLTLQEIVKSKPINDFPVHKRKLSKSQTLSYKQLLKNENFTILDSELGSVINLELYKNLIDNTYTPLSGNDLKYDKLELIENQSCLYFLWYLEGKTFDIKLDNSSDYIDITIYKRMNEIVEFSHSKKRFELFRDFDFGQEYGLAYLTDSFKVKLGKLFRIELIEL